LQDHYDYIIAGAGCAGLSLLCRMITSGRFKDKKILLVDKNDKNKNDRTWCFWETGEGYFEEIVYKRWDKLWFHSNDLSKLFTLHPYQYKMIRGIDFYQYCFKVINKAGNVTVKTGEISNVETGPANAFLLVDHKKITADLIFSSLPLTATAARKKDHYLLQHFKGWVIETDGDCFQADEATLMDFRISQKHGTSFVYVMPFSSTTALIEYTLFTPTLLKPEEYDQALNDYISDYFPNKVYTIKEQEFGVIPMTNQSFRRSEGRIVNIGMTGGVTKPSTGYTFRFIQKDSDLLMRALLTGKPEISSLTAKRKFHFYDSVLLNVLATGKYPGDKLFTSMFRNNNIRSIFRFLDNESHLPGDLRLISSLPFFPFLKAGISETVNNI
jgi:lycopene beta-cyclase